MYAKERSAPLAVVTYAKVVGSKGLPQWANGPHQSLPWSLEGAQPPWWEPYSPRAQPHHPWWTLDRPVPSHPSLHHSSPRHPCSRIPAHHWAPVVVVVGVGPQAVVVWVRVGPQALEGRSRAEPEEALVVGPGGGGPGAPNSPHGTPHGTRSWAKP